MTKQLLTLFLAFFSIGAIAQNDLRLVRLEASAGMYTSKDIYSSIYYDVDDTWGKNVTGTYFLGISFYENKRAEISIAMGYQKVNTRYGREYNFDHAYTLEFYTILPQVRFNWITSDDELFELYSTFAVGITMVDEEYASPENVDAFFPIPAFHVNGIGMRFGDKLGGFMEIGMGTKGLMSGGISYRL